MSEQKSRRFFTAVPLDFDRLFQRDPEITAEVYALGCHLAAESYRRRNTDGRVIEEFAANLAELFEVDKTTIHRRLRLLEQKGQIYCEVRERQRAPWRIILTGLANPLDEDDCGTTAAHEGRPMQQSIGGDAAVGTAENPAAQARPSFSPVQSLSQSTDPTNEPNLTKPLIEGEKLDHLVVETTAAGDDLADALERARLFDEMFPPRSRRAS